MRIVLVFLMLVLVSAGGLGILFTNVTRGGGLILRETGLVSPLDSIIRVYCTTSNC